MRALLAAGGLLLAMPALAAERDYCPSRPGLGTTPCTVAPGRVALETALADWTLDDAPDARTDTVLVGDTLVRVGVSETIELQLGWTPYGHQRNRDKPSGAVTRMGRVGDVLLGAKANVLHPDGSGVSIALQPFATLPLGRSPIGAGDWGAGLTVPVTFDLSDTVNLQTTSEVDAAVDDDGHGRHLAYSEVLGLGATLTGTLSGTLEAQLLRDEDPAGPGTQAFAAVSLGWMPRDELQFDIGATAGLNRETPDLEVYAGISRRF